MGRPEIDWPVVAGVAIVTIAFLTEYLAGRSNVAEKARRRRRFAGLLAVTVVAAAVAGWFTRTHRERTAKLEVVEEITVAAVALVESARQGLPPEWSIERVVEHHCVNWRTSLVPVDAGRLQLALDRAPDLGVELRVEGERVAAPRWRPGETVTREAVERAGHRFRAFDQALADARASLGLPPVRLALDGEPLAPLAWPLAFGAEAGDGWNELRSTAHARSIAPRADGVVVLEPAGEAGARRVVRIAWDGTIGPPVTLQVPKGEHVWELVVRADATVCGVMSRTASVPGRSPFVRCFARDGGPGESVARSLPRGIQARYPREGIYFVAAAAGIAFETDDACYLLRDAGQVERIAPCPQELHHASDSDVLHGMPRLEFRYEGYSLIVAHRMLAARAAATRASLAYGVSDGSGHIALVLNAEPLRLLLSPDGGKTWIGRPDPAPGDVVSEL